jgi:hypothetical protein
MIQKLKNLLIGSPLPTSELGEKRLNKIRALAVFSPDALSSIAYANQEIYLGLVVAGSAGLGLAWPIGLAITGLLVIVALSYYQTIQGYPSGGGSYIVARANLGTFAGLVAAAALLIDYLLTAAVSLTAGVGAIASAFPVLWPYRIHVALGLLLIIMIANLRGLRETGTLMAIPVYLFLFTYLPMLAYGLVRLLIEGPVAGNSRPALLPHADYLPDLAHLCNWLHSADRHRGYQQRCAGLSPARVEKRRAHPDRDGGINGAAFRRQHWPDAVPGNCRRPGRNHPFGAGPPLIGQQFALFQHPDFDHADPGGGGQHQLRRLPTPVGYPGQDSFLPPVHRPGRPVGVCQWHCRWRWRPDVDHCF